jgi:hypothetical protein
VGRFNAMSMLSDHLPSKNNLMFRPARNSASRLVSLIFVTSLTAISPMVVAQQLPQGTQQLNEIVVIGVTPVPGFKVDKDKIPGSIQTLSSSDLTRNGAANVLGALDQQVCAINFNDTIADPFQPHVLFRGFEASPLVGTPEGTWFTSDPLCTGAMKTI